MLTPLQMQPPFQEVPWEHHCWNSGGEGLHNLIFPDRIQGSLSEGEKGLCWAHPRTRGPYGCTKVQRACCQCCLARGSRTGRMVTPHFPPQPLASPTESKNNRKSRKTRSTPASQDAAAGKHRLTRAWVLHSFFHMSKVKKKFKEAQPWPIGSKHHSLDLRQGRERKVHSRACFRSSDVLGSWKRAVSWRNYVGS